LISQALGELDRAAAENNIPPLFEWLTPREISHLSPAITPLELQDLPENILRRRKTISTLISQALGELDRAAAENNIPPLPPYCLWREQLFEWKDDWTLIITRTYPKGKNFHIMISP
jgi:hypothetical protein